MWQLPSYQSDKAESQSIVCVSIEESRLPIVACEEGRGEPTAYLIEVISEGCSELPSYSKNDLRYFHEFSKSKGLKSFLLRVRIDELFPAGAANSESKIVELRSIESLLKPKKLPVK